MKSKRKKERCMDSVRERKDERATKLEREKDREGKEEIGKVVRVWVGMKVIMLMWPESGKGRATGKSQRQEWRVSKQC